MQLSVFSEEKNMSKPVLQNWPFPSLKFPNLVVLCGIWSYEVHTWVRSSSTMLTGERRHLPLGCITYKKTPGYWQRWWNWHLWKFCVHKYFSGHTLRLCPGGWEGWQSPSHGWFSSFSHCMTRILRFSRRWTKALLLWCPVAQGIWETDGFWSW